MSAENTTLIVSGISAVSGIIIAYIVNVAAKKIQERKAEKQPKDRMEQMFDGYERLIDLKDKEDHRKAAIISELQENIDKIEEELRITRERLSTSQDALNNSNLENKELKQVLHSIREEYKRFKAESLDQKHSVV